MATYNKFQNWVEEMADGNVNCSSDSFVVALTATANAPVATNTALANLTEIAYTNLSSRSLTTSTHAESGGTFTLLFADLVLSASGGSVAAFQYVVIYDDTPTTPTADPLMCWYDYGSSLTLADGESLTIDFTTSTWTLT